jgi:hypothetical protein
MRLSASARLALWEAAAGAVPAARDLALLEAGLPGADLATLHALSVAQCDARLLDLYEATVGPRLDAVFDCGTCGQTIEVTVDVPQLRAGIAPPASIVEFPPNRWVAMTAEGYDVRFRLPDNTDLAAVAALEPAKARAALADRIVRAWRDGVQVAVEALPSSVLDAAVSAMAEEDPMADLALSTSCPWCGAESAARLDIGAVLWARVDADARRLLSDVDTLARAYGWAEAEIVALTEGRRRAYLEMAG